MLKQLLVTALLFCMTSVTIASTSVAVELSADGVPRFLPIERAEQAPSSAVAVGHIYEEDYHKTGWAHQTLETSPDFPDEQQAFALGAVQGYLEHPLSSRHLRNWQSEFTKKIDGGIDNPAWTAFMADNMAFVEAAADNAVGKPREEAAVYRQVALMHHTARGYVAGFNARAAGTDNGGQQWQLTLHELWSFNSFGDSYQLVPFLAPKESAMAQFAPGSPEFERWEHSSRECSAFIAISEDNRDLFAAHSTWTSYTGMMRIFTHLKLNFSELRRVRGGSPAYISYSSKPGFIHGKDDHMVTDRGLHVHETSLSFYADEKLAENIRPEAFLSWHREQASIRLAGSAEEWARLFGVESIGTYSGTWVAVDFKGFDSETGRLASKSVIMREEVPGAAVVHDLTAEIMDKGYYASYNTPRTAKVDEASGNRAQREHWLAEGDEERANEYDAEKCTRARIFRRELEARRPNNVAQALSLIRLNDYEVNPVSGGDPHMAICARYDLLPENHRLRMSFGCIDGKVVSHSSFARIEHGGWPHWAHSGPTWGWQKSLTGSRQWVEPFVWSKFVQETPEAASPHEGHPDSYQFAPQYMNPSIKDFGI